MVGVGQDTTQLNRVAAEAKCVADDLTRLIDTANAPIFGVNLKGVVCDMRPVGEAVGGSFKS